MSAKERRGDRSTGEDATAKAISQVGDDSACTPTGRSEDGDWSPVLQHAVKEGFPLARSGQHGSLPSSAETTAAQTPRLMLVNSTRSSELPQTRLRPDICIIVVRSATQGNLPGIPWTRWSS